MGIAENSYTQNLKLLDDMNERKKQSIALPIDVNKIKLLVLAKKEDVIALKEDYKNLTNLIEKAIWHDVRMELVPKDPSDYHTLDIKFENDYEKFTQNSRTYKILEKLEKQSSLEVKKVASDLLPSTNLLIGYKVEGDEWGINGENDLLYAGISLQWPFPNQVERAQYRVSKIEHKKTKLSNQNKYLELQANLKNLYLGIKREKELIKIAELKMNLAEDILKDEAENYSFGKVTLNDYIDAVNLYDQNKFNKITHTVQIKKLLVEWLRLTDSLVAESSVMR
ncbi:MAG: TolC family protein [Proteobacteria bacterium]|nr:TolC family protein [Pseudomonadota bacterium]